MLVSVSLIARSPGTTALIDSSIADELFPTAASALLDLLAAHGFGTPCIDVMVVTACSSDRFDSRGARGSPPH